MREKLKEKGQEYHSPFCYHNKPKKLYSLCTLEPLGRNADGFFYASKNKFENYNGLDFVIDEGREVE